MRRYPIPTFRRRIRHKLVAKEAVRLLKAIATHWSKATPFYVMTFR